MGRKRKQWYVVFEGRATGLFKTWDETEGYVKGFKGARFKGYENKEDATREFAIYRQKKAIDAAYTCEEQTNDDNSMMHERASNTEISLSNVHTNAQEHTLATLMK